MQCFLLLLHYVRYLVLTIFDTEKGTTLSARARWKVHRLAYVKLGTSGRWVGTGTGDGVTLVKSFLIAAHGSMDIGECAAAHIHESLAATKKALH